MQSPKNNLEAFGLTEKEAAVYAAALELGAATADQLANQSGIKRSTTYLQIEQLQEKGLMSTFEQGKKTLFTPESPENLERLLEKQKKDIELKQGFLNKELPILTKLYESAGERPVVRFYQGKEGIETIRQEMLDLKIKETYVYFAADEMEELFSDEERDSYTEKRIKLGIKTKIIYTRNKGAFSDKPSENSERKYLSSAKGGLGSDIVVYDNKTVFFSMSGTVFGIVIESERVKKSILTIFNELWVRL
ncbi:MAG: helix-turn-helix domain-containing protein [Patescibacteria group bacterium]